MLSFSLSKGILFCYVRTERKYGETEQTIKAI